MTSLRQLIFLDIYSRHPKLSSDVSSSEKVESLSLAFENLFCMPYSIVENYGNSLCTLDISHNKFSRNLKFLSEFDNLTSLNLDYNNIDSYTVFPYLPHLRVLWLNNNNLETLFPFLKNLYKSVPNLRYLCLMGNKAAPSYLNGGSFYEYLQYRLFVISWFPHLIHLDDRVITQEQREEAKRLFKRPFLEQVVEKAPFPDCLKMLNSKIVSIFTKQPNYFKRSSVNSNFII